MKNLTEKQIDQIKVNATLTLLKDIAAFCENWKYHYSWIDKLNASSCESLYSDYRKMAPSPFLNYDSRIAAILWKGDK